MALKKNRVGTQGQSMSKEKLSLMLISIFLLWIKSTPTLAQQEQICLNFQEIELKAVLQLIADLSGFNLVVSDTVSGKVSVHLQNVSWQEALDTILKTKGLARRQQGKILFIAPSEEIVGQERLALQSYQQAQELVPLQAQYVVVNYAKASEMGALLKDKSGWLSSRGSVAVDDRTNTLFIQDTADKLKQIEALITQLDIPVQQVLIESRIVFASEDFEEELGINFSSSTKYKPDPSTPVEGEKIPFLNQLNVNLPTLLVSHAALGFNVGRLAKGTILDLELMALANEGRGKIVASPRLVTSNQQLAYIEAGEEIPYQRVTASGATSVSFKKAVLRLEVTPQITPANQIVLDLKVNQDSRGSVIAGVPAINTRELHTKILVADGETVVLGGIYQQQKHSQQKRVPILSKLPIVGKLFRNKVHSEQRNQLLIFVTPQIIHPAHSD